MSKILAALFTCISMAALAAGWHESAWDGIRGFDGEAGLVLHGVLVTDVWEQSSTGGEIPEIELPAGFGHEGANIPGFSGARVDSYAGAERVWTNEYYSIVRPGVGDLSGVDTAPKSWSDSAAIEVEGEIVTVDTSLARTYEVFTGAEGNLLPLDATSFDNIRLVELWLAIQERIEALPEHQRPAASVFPGLRSRRQTTTAMKLNQLRAIIPYYIVPMDDYTSWFETPSAWHWRIPGNEDPQTSGAIHPDLAWVLSLPLDFPRWTERDLCEAVGLPWRAVVNEVEETVFGWQIGQYETYEIANHTYDKTTYETYFDTTPARNLFMVENSLERGQAVEWWFEPYELRPLVFAGSWQVLRAPGDDVWRYRLYSEGPAPDYDWVQLQIGTGTNATHAVNNIVFDKTFIENVATNVTFTVTTDAIIEGSTLADYDIAGLKAVLDQLYVVSSHAYLRAETLKTKSGSGAADEDEWNSGSWADAVAGAEANYLAANESVSNDVVIAYNHQVVLPRPAARTHGRKQLINGITDRWTAVGADFSLRPSLENTSEFLADFEVYFLIRQPVPAILRSGTQHERIIDSSHHGLIGRAHRFAADIAIEPGNVWVASAWVGYGSGIPPWGREPQYNDPPTDDPELGHVLRGYTLLPRTLMRLDRENGFQYIGDTQ